MSADEIEQKIKEYSTFIENILAPDLQNAEAASSKTKTIVDEYNELQKRLQSLQRVRPTELDSMVDLGYNTLHCRAVVPDLVYVYVHVGMGFHVALTVAEALVFIDKRLTFLRNQVLSRHEKKVEEVKAHMDSAAALLRELQRELGGVE